MAIIGADGAEIDPLTGRDPSLDGVRAAACLMVYFFHLGIDLGRPPLFVRLNSGVTFFFVLSGYLMFGPFAAALRARGRPRRGGRMRPGGSRGSIPRTWSPSWRTRP